MASVITCTRASKTTRSCEQKARCKPRSSAGTIIYCLDACKGGVLQQQRNVAGAREENVALTPCSVSGTCSECCAPQTSLSRPFSVLLDIGGPGACQASTVARHSRLFHAPVTCLLFHMRGTKGGIERVLVLKWHSIKRDLMSSQHRCCPRHAMLLLLCFGAQQKRSAPHVFAALR
jgi:hypothetical protein